MIKSKPAALPSYCASTHSLIAVVYTVEVTLPETPPAVSSGESATLRLPLSIINGDVNANKRCRTPPIARLPCLFSIESRWRWAAWGK